MKAYDLMIKTNYYLIKGGVLTDKHKITIATRLQENRETDGRPKTFNNPHWYPKFYIPPFNNGKRLQTLVPTSPKSYIIADNAYEFEILRLLYLFDPTDEVHDMIEQTKNRLKKTCFGHEGCGYADCFEAALMVLRFLSFAAPHDTFWIKKQINVYRNHFADKRHHSGVQKYYWLILTDLPFEIAEPELRREQTKIIEQLNRQITIKTGNEEILYYVMRNALARLPEYKYLENREPYINAKNGKLCFEVNSIF